MKLLLIDEGDSPARGVLDVLAREEEGFGYEWAPDVASAVQRLGEPGVDVILMGLYLPDALGIEAFETVQAFAGAVPIVVLTGSGTGDDARRCLSLGAQETLADDDLSPELLVRVLRYAQERSRLLSALRDLSVVDDLTELYTLRGLTELGQHHLRAAQRMAQNVLLIYVGTGEVANGAQVETATLLRSLFRASDVVARVGEHEFAILAMDADPEAAPVLTLRLQDAAQRAVLEGRAPPMDLRVGYASLAAMPQATVPELLGRARQAANDSGSGRHQASRI